MSGTYKIQVDEDYDEIVIVDEEDEEVEYEVAVSLIKRLNKNYNDSRPAVVYLMYSKKMGLYKIGITILPVEHRRNALRIRYDDPTISVLHTIPCLNQSEAREKEKLLHGIFTHLHQAEYGLNGARRNLGREWFRLTKGDEFFIKSRNLFLPFGDSFTFHPLAFMRYATENNSCDIHLRQILVLTTELWAKYDELTRQPEAKEA